MIKKELCQSVWQSVTGLIGERLVNVERLTQFHFAQMCELITSRALGSSDEESSKALAEEEGQNSSREGHPVSAQASRRA